MSELNPTPKFWRAPVGFGLGALVLAIAIATTDFNPLWSIPAMAVVFMTFRGTASALHRRSYLRQLSRKVDRVPLAGLTPEGRGMRLTDVYIDVAVKPAEGPDSSERPFIGTGFWPDRRPPFLTALCRRRSAPIVIVGEPGSGKTTVLRRTVLELTRHHRLPILIDLPSLSGTEPPDLPQLVRDSYWLTRRPPDGWLRRQLTAGHCVVMLDGLDELASEHDRQRVADWIEAQRQNYPKNSFVITTRPDGLTPGPLPDAEFWQLRHLTDSQIASFLHDWCETVEKRKSGHNRHWARDEGAAEAGVLLSRLRAKPVLHQLAAHPLPLTLIALVHRHCGFLPDDRQALYNDAAALLVNGHADSVHRLAGQLMEARTTRLSSRDITAIAPQLDPRELIAEGSAAGWLTRTPDGRHAFTHLSLQQFFADRDIREADILTKIDDPWWRDAILLWSRRSNVSRVIESCLASGSITALALAYDAAETCGELDPGLLAELRELLSLATKTPTENRLVGAAKVARELSVMTPLFAGARIALRPISNSIDSSFLEAEVPAGRPPPNA
ncbi:MAG: NACHT domain-containing protein, partial [Stackebrandtia sp.]